MLSTSCSLLQGNKISRLQAMLMGHQDLHSQRGSPLLDGKSLLAFANSITNYISCLCSNTAEDGLCRLRLATAAEGRRTDILDAASRKFLIRCSLIVLSRENTHWEA